MTIKTYLPCPFCGKDDYEPEIGGCIGDIHVSCGFCGARAESGKNADEALQNWNTRAEKKDNEHYLRGFFEAKEKILSEIRFIHPDKEVTE